jgi:hypothetical protein
MAEQPVYRLMHFRARRKQVVFPKATWVEIAFFRKPGRRILSAGPLAVSPPRRPLRAAADIGRKRESAILSAYSARFRRAGVISGISGIGSLPLDQRAASLEGEEVLHVRDDRQRSHSRAE